MHRARTRAVKGDCVDQNEKQADSVSKDGEFARDPLMGRLKALYDDAAAEPLPEELLTLLAKLDEAERNR